MRFLLCCLFALVLASPAMADDRILADGGKTTYSIYHDPTAPKSVKRAAAELRITLEKATGAKFVVTATPKSPMICLGVNDASKAAGVTSDLPEIGFRIATRNSDIFILGNDTADGQEKWAGQVRQGTLLGTYDFLEKAANVRWLMPGEAGEDIPKTEKLVVADMNVTETPSIAYRWLLMFGGQKGPINLWLDRNKLDQKPPGAGINWSHSFNSTPPRELVRKHPEWMSMKKDGTRWPVPPDGVNRVMYCLSNQELIDAYANSIIEQFDKNPKMYSASMSPDEGAYFCECPDCAKLAMQIDDKWKALGALSPQRSPVVMRFYNEVAKRVAAKYPDRKVGGFIYQDYLVPPKETIKMEPNIVFGPAVNTGYGFKFYKPDRQAIFNEFISEWGKGGAEMGYYSYDTWMRNWFGMPLPPGKDLLKWNFPLFKQNKVQYLQYVGMEAWGYGACHNWMVAKLMWNADANVDALYTEFLTRAYGAEAGKNVDKIYTLIDDKLKAFIINTEKGPDHEIDYKAAKAIYGEIWLDVENLYLEATRMPMTDAQKKRLEMFGDNMIQAHFHMWKAKLITPEYAKASPLFKGTDDLEEFLLEKEKTGSIISVTEWAKIYRYTAPPVLRENWRPQ